MFVFPSSGTNLFFWCKVYVTNVHDQSAVRLQDDDRSIRNLSEELVYFRFVLFESRLIPTLFLILGWGYQPERALLFIMRTLKQGNTNTNF
jgi:hypothetical protein